jgi:hypothetical protein
MSAHAGARSNPAQRNPSGIFSIVSSAPDFAPAFLAFAAMGLFLVVVGLIVLVTPRGLGQRWVEWLYVHSPGAVESSDAAFARSAGRYRRYSALLIVFGAFCVYSSVSDILGR